LIRRYALAVGVGGAVAVVDLITKRHAAANFADAPVEVVPGLLSFTFVENPGAAFSLFGGAGPVMGAIAVLVTGFVLGTLRSPRPLLEVIALGLVLGGANGNLMDRVFRGPGALDGKVIDWVELWLIPTFNAADMSVTAAVALLLAQAWRTR